MKIALLGGIGFIATNTAIEAIKRGHTVVAFDNLSRKGVEENLTYMQNTYKDKYEFVWGDVRKRGDFEKIPIEKVMEKKHKVSIDPETSKWAKFYE